MEMKIDRPFYLEMDVLEIEDYLMSFKVSLIVNIEHPTGDFRCKLNSLWFSCADWDTFIIGLTSLSISRETKLSDMSDHFQLIISQEEPNMYIIKLQCTKSILHSGTVNLSYVLEADAESVAPMTEAFCSFPKWWQ